MVAYAVSKAAVASITQSLGEELADEGIFVNAIIPSIMNTPANRYGMPDADHSRWPGVSDVAKTVVFLLSAANASTRGGLIPVYGKA
jgi:NAD(P)-dependent dehydrogenase (short-subunit alcohol dehydrogenase family)